MANSDHSQNLIDQLDPRGVTILPSLPRHLRAIYLFEATMWVMRILIAVRPDLPQTANGVVPPPEHNELLGRTVNDAAILLYQMHNNPPQAPQQRAALEILERKYRNEVVRK
jgi:hypothetical protein